MNGPFVLKGLIESRFCEISTGTLAYLVGVQCRLERKHGFKSFIIERLWQLSSIR
jgi:hypothetical protein